MEIHRPKPVHGWRELLAEIGIIVIGVLIALSAEQLAEWIHWRHKVAELRASMTVELAEDDGPQAYYRLATRKCADDRLDEIQHAAEAGVGRIEVAKLTRAYPITDRTWEMDSWRAFLAADGPAHASSDEAYRWSGDFSAIPQLDRIGQDEREAVAELRAIRPSDGPMTPPELQSLAKAAERLRSENKWMVSYSAALLGFMTNPRQEGALAPLDIPASRRLTAKLVKQLGLEGCVETPDLSSAGLSAVAWTSDARSVAPR
jgi:hypothetical protein